MGSGPWRIYDSARRYLMTGDIDLNSDTFYVSLYHGSGNAADLTLQKIINVTGEVSTGFGYTAGGHPLTNVTWDIGASPSEMRFKADPAVWNAVGGNIVNVQYVVLWVATKQWLVAVAAVEENGSGITIADGNPLLIKFTNEGIFELN